MSDLISRQAAIDAHCEFCGDRDKCNCDICPDVEVFQLLPSAQPEPKTGRWITDGQKQKHGYEWMHCSVCGFSDIDVPATHTNYCPNCGAKMEVNTDG